MAGQDTGLGGLALGQVVQEEPAVTDHREGSLPPLLHPGWFGDLQIKVTVSRRARAPVAGSGEAGPGEFLEVAAVPGSTPAAAWPAPGKLRTLLGRSPPSPTGLQGTRWVAQRGRAHSRRGVWWSAGPGTAPSNGTGLKSPSAQEVGQGALDGCFCGVQRTPGGQGTRNRHMGQRDGFPAQLGGAVVGRLAACWSMAVGQRSWARLWPEHGCGPHPTFT